jgi:hypothetical protein
MPAELVIGRVVILELPVKSIGPSAARPSSLFPVTLSEELWFWNGVRLRPWLASESKPPDE